MAYNYEYPYTDTSRINDDWLLSKMKELIAEWEATKTQFDSYEAAWLAMKEYVETFFRDLDVQEEVNIKVADLVNDGTMSSLIAPYVTAQANPIFVDSTAEMIDHNKIYVLSSDGHVYTYKASSGSFTDTGFVYSQLDFIGDLTEKVKALYEMHVINEELIFYPSYIETDGTVRRGGSYSINRNQHYTQILDRKYFHHMIVTPNTGYSVCAAFYDDNGFVSRMASWSTNQIELDDTYNVVLMFASSTNTERTDDPTVLNTYATVYSDYSAPDLNSAKMEPEYPFALAWGNRAIHNTSHTRFSINDNLSLKSGLRIKSKMEFEMALYSVATSSTPLIYDWQKEVEILNDRDDYILVFRLNDESEIPSIDFDIFDVIEISDLSKFDNISKYLRNDIKVKTAQVDGLGLLNKWHGKTAVFVGDSVTAGRLVSSNEVYWQKLKGLLDLGQVTGMGVTGSCMSVTSGYGTQNSPISQRWNTIPEKDLIVIFAGSNDYGHNTPMGTIDDATDISFYGALNVIISGILNLYPHSRLAFMTPIHRYKDNIPDSTPNSAGNTLKDYVDAIKAACAKYSVPVIDTYSITGLNPAVTAIDIAYFEDKLHPNAAGHEELAERTYMQFNII